jgi:hypothetical protein
MSSAEMQDCHRVLSTLWAGLRGHLPVRDLSDQPVLNLVALTLACGVNACVWRR